MRKFFAFALLVGTLSLAAIAQEAQNAPKAEVFGGFQYTHFNGGPNASGWDTGLTGNITNWFGISADFSGTYGSQDGVSLHNYTYTFGPVVSLRENRTFTPWAHFLAGGNHATAGYGGVSGSDSGFAMMFGGGLDITAGQHLAVRGIQVDWLSIHSDGISNSKNMRIVSGILLRY
jgi:hypothetical protein